MTDRTMIAAMAMAGMLGYEAHLQRMPDEIAVAAIEYADELLAELAKEKAE